MEQPREPTPFLLGAFQFKRIRLTGDDGPSAWSSVEELGSAGWDLVTVSDGTAYLKRVIIVGEPPVVTAVCRQCVKFSVVGQMRGQEFGCCAETNVQVAADNSACAHYEICDG